MHNAFISNDRCNNPHYFAIMHNNYLQSVEKKRKIIRVWLRDVMQSQNMSAYEWATKAGTSPTNITRFLKDSKYMPSSKTLAKLSAVCGSSPDANIDAPGITRTLEVLNMDGNRVKYVNVYDVKGKVAAYQLSGPTGFGVGGIQMGDTVLVDLESKPKTNDIVLIRVDRHVDEFGKIHFDRDNMTTELMCGQLIDRHIIFKSTICHHTVTLAEVECIGVIIQCIKDFKN